MKKRFCALLAIMMAASLTLAGCGGSAPSSESGAPNSDAGAGNSTPATSTTTENMDLVMATGGTSGTYYPYGGAVATELAAAIPGLNINAQATGASAANIRMVRDNDADIAIVQNDVMSYAYNGTESFAGEQITEMATMATLYAEVCQIIVDPDSGITTVADLKGKRVSVGDAGSGVESNAKQILDAYGLSLDDISKQNLSFGDSANAMKDKKIDAFFVTAGTPTTAIMELVSTNKIALLSIDDDKCASLIEQYPFYTKYTIPAGTYSGIDADVTTLAVKATFIVRPALSEDLVYNMTKALFEGKDNIAAAHSKGTELDPESAVQGVSVPLHPGAEKYFKEIGVLDSAA